MRRLVLGAVVLFLSAAAAIGGTTFSVSAENDTPYNEDRFYTHGTRFELIWDEEALGETNSEAIFESSPVKFIFGNTFGDDKERSCGFALGQYLYTPSDLSVAELQEDDRPYGGWLYGAFQMSARDDDELDFFEVEVGITGEPAGCGPTQKFVHRLSESQDPKGWDNQIEPELGVNLIYQKKNRWRLESDCFDFITHYGGSVGNISTYANAGAELRLGYNLPDDFGVTRMEPTARKPDYFGAWLFAGVDERYVVRNIFLDGNTFEDSHSVDKKPFVTDLTLGAGVTLGDFDVLYAYNLRSKEFEGQEEAAEFGSIVLRCRF